MAVEPQQQRVPERRKSKIDREWSQLLQLIAERRESALSMLYDQSSALVFSIAYRILSDRGDAEEVTLDVFNYVWRSAENYDASRGSVANWLVMLARSRAIDRFRSTALRAQIREPLADPVEIPVDVPDPEETAVVQEHRRIVRDAVATLPKEQRQAIELAFFSALSHSEVAGALGEPLGTVKTRIRLGLRRLQTVLAELSGLQ